MLIPDQLRGSSEADLVSADPDPLSAESVFSLQGQFVCSLVCCRAA